MVERWVMAKRHADMPPDVYTDGSGKIAKVAIWRDGKHFPTQMCWGLQPSDPNERTLSLLRAEGRTFERRCLIIANDFDLRPGSGYNRTRRRVELITSDRFFCFAGTWRPETSTWPAAFAGITIEAYPDIEPYQDRHM
jgi:putative SOS response-associated peptidase YedK